MDEQDETRIALPSGPVERAIVEIVAEIGSGGAGRSGGEAAIVEMDGNPCCWAPGVEASRSFRADDRPRRKGAVGVSARRGPVMGEALDAETGGVLATLK